MTCQCKYTQQDYTGLAVTKFGKQSQECVGMELYPPYYCTVILPPPPTKTLWHGSCRDKKHDQSHIYIHCPERLLQECRREEFAP